jgi:YegS/Rv2252/BmrU family lipid kinase
VANGILASDAKETELGILPSGTGGDFRRTLAIPSSAEDAARALRRGKTRTIDAGRVTYLNHEGLEESRFFLGVASCGLSAHVIERVKGEKEGWAGAFLKGSVNGKLSFAAATLRTTLEAENTWLKVRLDEKEVRAMKVVNFCVANARFFGGGMKIAPDAKINDGVFDIIVIGDLSALDILANGYRLYTGSHLSLKRVHHTRARRVELHAAMGDGARVALEVDGELPGYLPAAFEIVPGALRVRCPE